MSTHPTHIGAYEVVRLLGRGGMGAVYLARDPAIGRLVAIKLLREGVESDELRERFAREARAAGGLRHPNIVTIFQAGPHEVEPYLVMEYIPGDTLAQVVERRMPLTVPRKLRIIEEVCHGLAYAHRAGIVHRDVKPANILVDPDGIVKILDFGIARMGEPGLTRSGMVVGSLNYMAPEQIDPGTADHRSDVFAVGLVLYELLTYQKAFPGQDFSVFHRILHTEPQPVEHLVEGVPPDLAEIVGRALKKNPDDRYQDLAGMRAALSRVRMRLRRGHDDVSDEGPLAASSEAALSRDDDTATQPSAPSAIEVLLADARQALDAERFAEAVEACDKVVALVPHHQGALDIRRAAAAAARLAQAQTLLGVAQAEWAKGDESRVREVLHEAEEVAAGLTLPTELGLRLATLKDEIAALEAARLAARRLVSRGEASLAGGQLDEARSAHAKAHELAPSDASVLQFGHEIAEAERQVAAERVRQAAEQARLEAEALARREAEEAAERTRLETEAEAERVRQAEVERVRQAAEQARLAAEALARREAEEAEERARLEIEAEAERVRQAEAERVRQAEERARLEAEALARREVEEAAERARLEAEAEAARVRQAEAERVRQAEERARLEAEALARREAEEAEERARLEAEAEAERVRQAEAERVRLAAEQARLEAEALARREAEEAAERARLEAEAEAEAERARQAEVEAKRQAAAQAAAEKVAAEKAERKRAAAEARARREAEEAEERARRDAQVNAVRVALDAASRQASAGDHAGALAAAASLRFDDPALGSPALSELERTSRRLITQWRAAQQKNAGPPKLPARPESLDATVVIPVFPHPAVPVPVPTTPVPTTPVPTTPVPTAPAPMVLAPTTPALESPVPASPPPVAPAEPATGIRPAHLAAVAVLLLTLTLVAVWFGRSTQTDDVEQGTGSVATASTPDAPTPGNTTPDGSPGTTNGVAPIGTATDTPADTITVPEAEPEVTTPPAVRALHDRLLPTIRRADVGAALTLIERADQSLMRDPVVQADLDRLLASARRSAASAQASAQEADAPRLAPSEHQSGLTRQTASATALRQGDKPRALRALHDAATAFTQAAVAGRAAALVASQTPQDEPRPPQPSEPARPAGDTPADPPSVEARTQPVREPAPSPPPVVTQAQPVDETPAIRAVLDLYVRGYETLDVGLVRRAWPSAPSSLDFSKARSQSVTLRNLRVSQNGASATATCTFELTAQMAAARPQSVTLATTFSLRKNAGGWIITSVSARR